jgi:hypothetical protein
MMRETGRPERREEFQMYAKYRGAILLDLVGAGVACA